MAVFINPQGSAELDKVSSSSQAPTLATPGTPAPGDQQHSSEKCRNSGADGDAEGTPRREVTPSRMACHCHNPPPAPTSSGSGPTSRYENVATSVASSHAHPTPPPPPLILEMIRRMSGEPIGTPDQQHKQQQMDRPPQSPTSVRHSLPHLEVSGSCFARIRLFFEHSPLRHFVPFLVLFLYALLGALLFFLLESEHERQLLEEERGRMELLRERTLQKLERTLMMRGGGGGSGRVRPSGERWARSREVLTGYEKAVAKSASTMPEGTLEWNYLGALFYVGTVFTTIGYGDITPRTTPGQALSILYAIVGIPLVLAILNQTSKRMTKWLSEQWIWYRRRARRKGTMRKRSTRRKNDEREMEEGRREKEDEQGRGGGGGDGNGPPDEEQEQMESRTIPVWLALSLVGGYVCSIAAIFLIWETRWSYFTSFYFICISCLTIGLGDVVPDHPYLLILMFVFVILGLSCVSMLLSVIQIKMEEWLFRMLMRMQKEYQKALHNVRDPVERDRIVAQLMAKEPWYMRELAPMCISEGQRTKLEQMADENYERVMRPMNTKGTQTERKEGEEEEARSRRDVGAGQSEGEERKANTEEEVYLSARAPERNQDEEEDSVSDATSLPMDPASFAHGPSARPSREVQTELQGGAMERMMEEGEWEERRRRRRMGTRTVGTGGGPEEEERKSRGTQCRATMTNKRTDTQGLIRLDQRAVGTDQAEGHRTVQTMFPSEEEGEESGGGRLEAEQRRRVFSFTGREDEVDEEEEEEAEEEKRGRGRAETGTQCSPPPPRENASNQTEIWMPDEGKEEEDEEGEEGASFSGRERSESVAATVGDDDELDELMNQAYPERRVEKKDLVIQTDDSYLRIARRLDKLRTNRTDINVYCTGVNPPPSARRKSLRFLDNFRNRRQSKAKAEEEVKKEEEGEESRKKDEEEEGGKMEEEGGEQVRKDELTEPDRPSQQQAKSPPPSPLPSAMARKRPKGGGTRHVRMMEDERKKGEEE